MKKVPTLQPNRNSKTELASVNKELTIQTKLNMANVELSALQYKEKEKRAAELVIANKELAFQNKEKRKRAAELVIANKELVVQNKAKIKAARKLGLSEIRLLKAQEVAHVGSWELDFDTRSVHFSDEACRIVGINPAEGNEYTLEDCLTFVHFEDVGLVTQLIRESHNSKSNVSFDHRIIRRDGTMRYIYSESKFECDATGLPIGLHGIAHDITERKNAELALQLSEEKFRALYDSTSDAVMLLTDKGFFDCNNATLKLFGCTTKAAFCSKHPADLSPPHQPSGIDSITLANEQIALAMEKGNNHFEWVHKRLDTGADFYADVLLNKIVLNGQQVIEAVVRNIDVKKAAEKKLTDSETKYRALIENITDGIVLINENSETVYQSPSAERITGFTTEDTKDRPVFEFIHPDDRENCMEFFIKVFAQPGVPQQNKYRILHKQGHYIWIEGTITNLLHNESVKAFIVNYRDITERVESEKEIKDLNENLEQKIAERTAELTQANVALEAFSYSVSHDLRSPVRAVMGFTKIITNDYGQELCPEVKELFSHIESGSRRMNAIIDDLLTLAKSGRDKLKLTEVDLTALFNNVWDNLLFTAPHQAKLILPTMPVVRADSSMLQQVIVNLLSNAIKYSAKRKEPHVAVGYEITADTITISVEDNGAGFDMRYYDRLFGVFQRLHSTSEFEGTGIGLTLIKRIINRHGGIVWAEGKVNEGATFYFTLPL